MPKSFIKDEDTWKKAKAAVDPEGKGAAKYDNPYAVVTDVYKKMGGQIGKQKEKAGYNTPASGSGITVPCMMMAQAEALAKVGKTEKKSNLSDAPQDGDEAARKMLIENPHMAAASLYNNLKAKGYAITDKTKQADSGSSMAAPLRAKPKESNPAMKSTLSFQCRVQEAAHKNDGIGPTSFKTILIQEGLGNLKDTFYYTREALESAIPLFTGKKIYANHPSRDEEENRPERDVRDILGHFENIHIEEDEEGRAQLVGDVVVLSEEPFRWARALMNHAVDYSEKFPDKEFVGLSINASGNAQEKSLDDLFREDSLPRSVLPKLQKAKDQGIDSVRVVNELNEAVSCDLVTEAGAGGKILALMEQEKSMAKKESEKKEKKIEAEDEMKQKKHEYEDEKKEDEKKEDGDDGHDDEDQDKALIKKMIKKHLGDDHADDEDTQKMAQMAYEAYKEMGHEGEEAEEMAGKHMKAAYQMGKAMAAKKDDDGDADDKHESEDEKKESEDEKKEAKKLERALISQKATTTHLLEKLKKYELAEYLDQKLNESKKPMSFTKKFREALGAPKSKEQINESWNLFVKSYEALSQGGDLGEGDCFIMTEKSYGHYESPKGQKGSFEDCVD